MEEVAEDYPYLDKPLPVQYVYWLADVFRATGVVPTSRARPSARCSAQRAPATFFIVFWAIVMGLVIAVPLGVYSAYRRDKFFDKTSSVSSFAVISMPPLVVAVLLLYLVVVRVDMFSTVAGSTYVAPVGQSCTSTSRTSSYPRSRWGSVSARYGAASFAAT